MSTAAFEESVSSIVKDNQIDGRIAISKITWTLRIAAVGVVLALALWIIISCLSTDNRSNGINYLVLFGGILLIHTAIVLVFAWTLYKNPAAARRECYGNYKVAVIVPIYNQEKMIEKVIEAIYQSSYKKIEVIAVNDGSTDGTSDVLDHLKHRYSDLVVAHKKNSGKRRTVAAGFRLASAEIIVLLDSDSVIHPIAIEEFVKAFESDEKIGAVVGNARVLNGQNNLLTKCQDAWYDYSFNVSKACESHFSNVTCCSGCLAGYRRQAIELFIDAWSESDIQDSDDAILTSILLAGNKSWLARTTLKNAVGFDDSEDRILTIQSLQRWKTLYVASSLVYTEVPETAGKYIRQQIRWKKGYLRSTAFASTFMWRRNSIMSYMFYLEFLMTAMLPFVVVFNVIYQPLVNSNYISTATFTTGLVLLGLVQGLDYKARVRNNSTWKYQPLMVLITTFINIWLVVPALITMKKNEWGTR
jgi:hyaluronan synthase